jgi:hypothetical protein
METIVTTRSEGLRSLPWRSLGVWLLAGLLVGVFVLDVALPGVVLLPFMYVPVVAAATFAGPRIRSGPSRRLRLTAAQVVFAITDAGDLSQTVSTGHCYATT